MNYPADLMRNELSAKYLSGSGIEIGALCHPLQVKGEVKYIDRFDRDGLHDQYPEIPTDIMCPVDIVDDGEHLEKIEVDSQDFIIANHFLEHCNDPIYTVVNWIRILKKGGVIFCAVPNKDECFDKDRVTTTYEHVEQEFREQIYHEAEHYAENQLDPSTNYSIHYHCWDFDAIHEFWDRLCEKLPIKVEESCYNPLRQEFIFIVRKKDV